MTWFSNNQRESNRPSPLPNGGNDNEFNRMEVFTKKLIKVSLTPLMNSPAMTIKAVIVAIPLLEVLACYVF